MKSRPRRFRLFPKSTAADVGISRFVRHTNATNTAAPISTITDIDCGRCGLIEVLLVIHRLFCRFEPAQRAASLATPCATLRGTLETLPAVPALLFNRLGAGLRPSPTLFFGYRFVAGKAHLSRAPSLLATGLSHRSSNVHRGLRWVAPPAPPLLRLVCSASVVAASSPLPSAECQPRPVAFSFLPPSSPPPPPPVPPSHTPRGGNNRLGHFLSATALSSGARLRPRPPL